MSVRWVDPRQHLLDGVLCGDGAGVGVRRVGLGHAGRAEHLAGWPPRRIWSPGHAIRIPVTIEADGGAGGTPVVAAVADALVERARTIAEGVPLERVAIGDLIG